MPKGDKANRTRQIQFRMEPDLAKRLQSAIVFDDSMHSMADLFNEAAQAYLADPVTYRQWISQLTQSSPKEKNAGPAGEEG